MSEHAKAGDHVGWKPSPTEEELAQIARWEREYGAPPYRVVAVIPHPEIAHLSLETPSNKGPNLPVSFFEVVVVQTMPETLAPPAHPQEAPQEQQPVQQQPVQQPPRVSAPADEAIEPEPLSGPGAEPPMG